MKELCSQRPADGLYAAMLLDGLCVSGAALVVPLVREQYGADYALAGLLLAF